MLHDSKILMTGATGMVGRPIATALARTNEVWAAGRFGDSQVRAAMEDAGVRTLPVDLGDTDLPALPDVDYVLNFAISRTNDWGVDLDANAGGLAALMHELVGHTQIKWQDGLARMVKTRHPELLNG